MSKLKRLIKGYKANRPEFIVKLIKRFVSWLYTIEQIRKLVQLFVKTKEPQKWVFIVGCYNSGTTLLKSILAAHGDIDCLPREGVKFTKHLTAPEELGWTRMWVMCKEYISMNVTKDKEIAEQIIKDWSPFWTKGKTIFIEKSIANVVRMEWLDKNFDNAYFIGITRNHYCSIEGIKRKARPGKKIRDTVGNEYPLNMIVNQCKVSLEVLEESSKNVNSYFEITYEELVSDPVTQLISIYDFIGVTHNNCEFSKDILMVNDQKFLLKNMNKESISRLTEAEILEIDSIFDKQPI